MSDASHPVFERRAIGSPPPQSAVRPLWPTKDALFQSSHRPDNRFRFSGRCAGAAEGRRNPPAAGAGTSRM